MTRIVTTLTNAAAIATRLADRVPAALQALSDHEPGYPASTPGSGSVGGGHGGGASSPVERLAGRVGGDRVLADRAELHRLARRVEGDLGRMLHIVTAATTHRTGTEGAGVGADCCSNHERVGDYGQPVYRAGLCRWCYDHRLAEGVAPSVALMEARARDGRVTPSALRFAKAVRR